MYVYNHLVYSKRLEMIRKLIYARTFDGKKLSLHIYDRTVGGKLLSLHI